MIVAKQHMIMVLRFTAYTPWGDVPSYFDYDSDPDEDNTIANYYSVSYDTENDESLRLKSAESLLLHLASYTPTLLKVAILSNHEVNFNEFVFVLGTDLNGVSLNNAANNSNISENLNITIFTPSNPVPDGFVFSDYGVIFLESYNKTFVDEWSPEIKCAKAGGAKIIGYNLSSDIILPNVDLYSDDYTDIERYWIQGGAANMENMLISMGQKFSGLWEEETIPEPVLLKEKLNLTFIVGADSNLYYLDKVTNERDVILDNFNVNIMTPSRCSCKPHRCFRPGFNIGVYDRRALISPQLSGVLSAAKDSGTEISLGNTADVYGLNTVDTQNPPHDVIIEYLDKDGKDKYGESHPLYWCRDL
ncbi:hypothetical protein [uncultured Methanolobus sp.]|uniref:hypothetical protein n=1 Tax=uncultured Methanolobus sp. TaxID=218300 RepID=UPI002AAAC3E9|nr:hypothetical protein [uncultured Methanolobus sp.]